MPPRPTIPAPALCRLCRRPITRATLKCPHCGARVSLSVLPGEPHAAQRPLRLRVTAYAVGLGLLAVIAALWFWVVREINTPLSADGTPSTSSQSAECATFLAELKRIPANQRATPEIRQRLRQCLEGR